MTLPRFNPPEPGCHPTEDPPGVGTVWTCGRCHCVPDRWEFSYGATVYNLSRHQTDVNGQAEIVCTWREDFIDAESDVVFLDYNSISGDRWTIYQQHFISVGGGPWSFGINAGFGRYMYEGDFLVTNSPFACLSPNRFVLYEGGGGGSPSEFTITPFYG